MQKYKLLKELLAESHAITHVAKNVKKDEKVAIKIFKKKYYSLEECRSNREMQVLQKLDHKNVLKMIEMINDANELLMVMEYLPETIKGVLKKRDKPFNEMETRTIMQQFLKGLDHVHKFGFMHRALRPEILQCNDDASVVKISDFLTAKSIEDSPLGEFVTPTVWYTAPEVLLCSTNYSTPIDMWAVGCIMAELLTGKPLLPGSSNADQMYKICTLIGTFTRGEWPEGSMLARQVGYTIPRGTQGVGLREMGLSSDAKGLICDVLVWTPEKRQTADKCLRHAFFKSEGNVENSTESMEVLMSAEEKLRTWREKWQPNLNQSSISEFDSIIAGFSSKQPSSRQSVGRNTFPGYQPKDPLFGDFPPRGSAGRSQEAPRDALFGDSPPRGSAGRNQDASKALSPKASLFDDGVTNQKGKYDNHPTQRNTFEELFSNDDMGNGQKQQNIYSPRGNSNQIADAEAKERAAKAERMKQTNPLKYQHYHGDDFLRSLFGGNRAAEHDQADPKTSPQQDKGRGSNPLMASSSNDSRINSKNNFNLDLQPGQSNGNNAYMFANKGQAQNDNKASYGQMSPRKSTENEPDPMLDHYAKAERMRKKNPARYNDLYGGSMKNCLGSSTEGKLEGKPDTSNSKDNGELVKRSRQDDFHYKPSWAEGAPKQSRNH